MNRPMGVPVVDPLYADLRRRDPVQPAVLLDVRERDEFAAVRVEGSQFIPMSELAARLAEVPRDRPILVMCASVGGITVSELGLGGGEGGDAKRIRADILQQSTYGIRRVRAAAGR